MRLFIVFRFLLTIKWGIWTLENLRFPKSQKNRKPFILLNLSDLMFKRLALLRNWILYSMQCIHSHLMTQVLQSMGAKLDKNIENTKNLSEIIHVHKSYIRTINQYCFQSKADWQIRLGIEQVS